MDITFHGCKQDSCRRLALLVFCFFFLNIWYEIGNRFFHHAGAFNHLRKKHLALGEQVTDYIHTVHQRPFDNVQRAWVFLPGLFRVFGYIVYHSLYESVLQPFFDCSVTPLGFCCFVFCFFTLDCFRKLHKTFGCVWPPVEKHILNPFQQCTVNFIIHGKLTCIDNAHVETRPDSVEQESGMHRFPYRVVPAERKRDITNAARHSGMRQVLLDPADRFDKIGRIVVVFLNTGCDSQDVRVENDVFRGEANLICKNPVSATANFDAAVERIGLSLFVEGHHDRSGTVLHNLAGMFPEWLFSFLQTDRVDDTFPLSAAETAFDH